MRVKYQTAETRKQRLKWLCYVCILSGHRAFEYTEMFLLQKEKNHHHRICVPNVNLVQSLIFLLML